MPKIKSESRYKSSVNATANFTTTTAAPGKLKCPFVPVGTQHSFNIYLGNSNLMEKKLKPLKKSLHTVQRTVSMKAKNISVNNRKCPPASNLMGQWKKKRTQKANNTELIAETPKDLNSNKFLNKIVTSTQLKNFPLPEFTLPNAADTSPPNTHISNAELFKFIKTENPKLIYQNDINCESDQQKSPSTPLSLSPLSPQQQQQQHQQRQEEQQLAESGNAVNNSGHIEIEKEETKFEFMFYSPLAGGKLKAEIRPNESVNNQTKKIDDTVEVEQSDNHTIEQDTFSCNKSFESNEAAIDKPSSYLSPFVSVSRGKVNRKIEQNNRNSIYNISSVSFKENIDDLRTLESVRYHRKQLQDEIERLNSLCDEWEAYKANNLIRLQEMGCDDMIDVTIGQTRLLTGKKFMQFKGLIDRCEAFATKTNDIKDDGTEATKLVTAIDLEGFWAMLGLQVDNLEKRFNNLNRWKTNNWSDPDEIKPKTIKVKPEKKSKPIAVKKATGTSAFIRMIRQKQLDMRKNSEETQLENTSMAIAKRTPIVIKDRKYFSPSPTVLTMLSPAKRRIKLSEKHPKFSLIRQQFDEDLRNLDEDSNLCKFLLTNQSPANSLRIASQTNTNLRNIEETPQTSRKCERSPANNSINGSTAVLARSPPPDSIRNYRSIVVKDRKYFSPAATVLKVLTPFNSNRISTTPKYQ